MKPVLDKLLGLDRVPATCACFSCARGKGYFGIQLELAMEEVSDTYYTVTQDFTKLEFISSNIGRVLRNER